METKHRDWQAISVRLQVVLFALLVVIASFVILYVVLTVLSKFYGTILLFVLGAIVAYLLIPVVDLFQRLVRKRWAAVLTVYLCVFLATGLLGMLLLNPFVQQAQSLARNLQHPSQSSLKSVSVVKSDTARLQSEIAAQYRALSTGATVTSGEIGRTQSDIASLQADVGKLGVSAPRPAKPLSSALPPPTQTQVPPSYITPISSATTALSRQYANATQGGALTSASALKSSVGDAQRAASAASTALHTMSSTPLLVLDLQTWLDSHGFNVNINQRFGAALSQINSQAASLINNAASIVLTAGTLLLNLVLMLIISIYFLSDGPRLVRKATQIGPAWYSSRAPFYVASLDHVLGGYIRGQIVLAAIAALLGAVGAWVLGVPYAVLIGISTFFLILIPVIGAVILIIPPFLIALVFTPLPTPIFLLVYYLVMMQIVTNVVGPRVMGSAVGIHPLEAMAAALIGFPLAGFLGSFFAVPIVGFIHIAVRQAYRDFGKREIAELEATFRGEPVPDPTGPPSDAAPHPLVPQ